MWLLMCIRGLLYRRVYIRVSVTLEWFNNATVVVIVVLRVVVVAAAAVVGGAAAAAIGWPGCVSDT